LDISKFLRDDNSINVEMLELAVRLSVRFLDDVVSVSSYPTNDIARWSEENRPIGLGIMGLADYYLLRGVAYGSRQANEELAFILSFIRTIATEESITLGEERGVPKSCSVLPNPRRNITLLTIAPTGTISLIAGCNSGIEPFFSDLTKREDKTGEYEFDHTELSKLPWYRCSVSSNGAVEVTWQEHIETQATAQKFVDSGVSKTINFPNSTDKDTIYESFLYAWKLGVKGITVYRNGSRDIEVLKPKNIKKDMCPVCEKPLIHESGCSKCSDPDCGFSFCDVA
jgi:ribonucleoside-diphosphate reductase alpha chain